MKTEEEQMKTVVNIPCQCGFQLGLREFDLDEIANGVWGTIKCPKCGVRLNPEIQTFYRSIGGLC